MNNEIIVVRQLPVIEEQLRTVHDTILARVTEVLAMECTEETYKEVKKARSDLNAQYRMLEDRRKEVKAQIEAPYKQFEAVYKACAGDLFSKADKQLAEKIAAVENGLKQKKAESVRAFFMEYRESLGIPEDLVSYEQAGIVVNLSVSAKALRGQATNFLDHIRDDLALIELQDHKEEILVEYRESLNVSHAVTTVRNRHEAIERERKVREQMAMAAAQQKTAEEAVQRVLEEVSQQGEMNKPAPMMMPPVVVERTEDVIPAKLFSTSFRVTGTIEQLKSLKNFLVDGGYAYEQLT